MVEYDGGGSASAYEMQRALTRRRNKVLEAAGLSGRYVVPAYDGASLVNVPATLGRLLGVELPGVAVPLREAYWRSLAGVRRIVLVLLDALGYRYLRRAMAEDPQGLWARLSQKGLFLPMTSAFPSTTNTCLASLTTGRAPAAHGLLGYELWLRELGVLAEMLSLRPAYGAEPDSLVSWGLNPESFIPAPPIGSLLARQGVKVTAVVSEQHRGSGLTRMLYRDVSDLVGYSDVKEMWNCAREALREPGPSLVFVYYGGIDSVAHHHGRSGGFWQRELAAVTEACESCFFAPLTATERQDTLLVLVADHGFVASPAELGLDADDILRAHLAIPYSGESRAAFLHALDGPSEEAGGALREALGPDFALVRTSEALESGLFGPPPYYDESLVRLGHFLALPRGLQYLDRFERRRVLRGRHGGLSADEMLIPWLACRLDS